MKNISSIRLLILFALALAFMSAGRAGAEDAGAKHLTAKAGSRMRLEGTSNIHDWQAEATLIGGYLEVGPGFPLEPGQSVPAGPIAAKGVAIIEVNLIKSVKSDGTPYDDTMDERIRENLKMATNPKIVFHLRELTLTTPAPDAKSPYLFASKGDLEIAGVTNQVAIPVKVLPLGGKSHKVKISGATEVKMTDYKITPPAPKIALGIIHTGDPVKLTFDWMVGPSNSPSPATK
jgi:hypothetical protein